MSDTASIAEHWGPADAYDLIVTALQQSGKSLDSLGVDDLAPIDHFHARGYQATVELADQLPVRAGDHILDLGCGLGGPARYFAHRFGCRVTGVDLTPTFVDAARKLNHLLGVQERVTFDLGDVQELPYADASFDGAYAQHVTMNIADRPRLFAGAFRVLKPGAFLAVTEHGLGDNGEPRHPVPWSEDGSGEWLVTPDETRALLETAGFVDMEVVETGHQYLESYHTVMDLAAQGKLPPLGIHLLLGATAPQKVRNAAGNIEQGRTQPIRVVCRKP